MMTTERKAEGKGVGLQGFSRIVEKDLFLFLLDHEVKRARRYQNFLSLLGIKLIPLPGGEEAGMEGSAQVMTGLLRDETRESDLLGQGENNQLFLLLPYADSTVAGRVKSRFENVLKYCDFKEKGCEVRMDQVCFPVQGTNPQELLESLGGQTHRAYNA